MKHHNRAVQNLPEEQPAVMQYLGELVRSEFEHRNPAPVPDNIEIDQIIEYAVTAQMNGLLFGALEKLELDECTHNKIKSYLVGSVMKSATQMHAVQELNERFEAEGIRFQVLKGAIMKEIYPASVMRDMSDIDVIVYDKSLDHAEKVVQELGYSKVEFVKHHVIYEKPPFLTLEVHWALYDKEIDLNQSVYFDENFRAFCKQGKKYTYEFSEEDFYVYMIAHMAKHFYENGCGIRNLADVYVFYQKYGKSMEQDKLQRELKKCGLTAFEEHMRKLSYIWMEDSKSTSFYNDLFEYMLHCGIYGKGENGIWSQLAKNDADQRNARLLYYFPGLSYMKDLYPWLGKYPALLPVSWVCRAVHGLEHGAAQRNAALAKKDSSNIERILELYKTLNLNFRRQQ